MRIGVNVVGRIVRNGVMHAKLQSTRIYSSGGMCELSLCFTLILHYVLTTMLLALMANYLFIRRNRTLLDLNLSNFFVNFFGHQKGQ